MTARGARRGREGRGEGGERNGTDGKKEGKEDTKGRLGLGMRVSERRCKYMRTGHD